MSERQPEPPQKARRNDDEPDVEGHIFRDPEKARLNDDEPDESQETGEGRQR